MTVKRDASRAVKVECKPPLQHRFTGPSIHPLIQHSITYPDDNIIWQIEWVSLNSSSLAPIDSQTFPPSLPWKCQFLRIAVNQHSIHWEIIWIKKGCQWTPVHIIRRFNFRIRTTQVAVCNNFLNFPSPMDGLASSLECCLSSARSLNGSLFLQV